jgi:hypothetical protein
MGLTAASQAGNDFGEGSVEGVGVGHGGAEYCQHSLRRRWDFVWAYPRNLECCLWKAEEGPGALCPDCQRLAHSVQLVG